MIEGPLRQVQLLHEPDPSTRTFWPGRSACTPAVTTTSPVSSPSATVTVAGSKRASSTFLISTVDDLGSTIQTAGLPLNSVNADEGIAIIGTASVSSVPVTVAPAALRREDRRGPPSPEMLA